MNSPAFQAYPKDWLSSAHVTMMTPAEEGAFWRLLCHAWLDPDCSLPDDDQALARLSRLGEAWIGGPSNIVRNRFVPHPTLPGRLVNLRLLKEREVQQEWRSKSAKGGRIGAAKRWKGHTSKENGGGHKMVKPRSSVSDNQNMTPLPLPLPLLVQPPLPPTGGKVVDAVKPLPQKLDTPRMRQQWSQWQTCRRAMKKPKSWEMLFNAQLEWLSRFDEATALEILSASIRNGWQGLFEPKNSASITTPPPLTPEERERQAIAEACR